MLNPLFLSFVEAKGIAMIDAYIMSGFVGEKPSIIEYDKEMATYFKVKLELVMNGIYRSPFDLELVTTHEYPIDGKDVIISYNKDDEHIYIFYKDFYEEWKFPRWPRELLFCWINTWKNTCI